MHPAFLILGCALALSACSSGREPAHQAPIASSGEPVALSPGVTPVRIGEDGPGSSACGARGAVVNLSAAVTANLPVRASPFIEADEVARLGNGARMFVCTRSLDQKWLGVVLPSDAPSAMDCGVSAPVGSPRDYVGPCRSGWVSSAFVQLIAG